MDPMSAISAGLGALTAVFGAVGGIAGAVNSFAGLLTKLFDGISSLIGESQQGQAQQTASETTAQRGWSPDQSNYAMDAINGTWSDPFGGAQGNNGSNGGNVINIYNQV